MGKHQCESCKKIATCKRVEEIIAVFHKYDLGVIIQVVVCNDYASDTSK